MSNQIIIPAFQNQWNLITKLQEEVVIETARLDRMTKLYQSVDLNRINDGLSKLGLNIIRELSVGFAWNKDITIEELQTRSLTLSYRVESIGSIKPIVFAGYTKSGLRRNHDKLINKSVKLEEKIKAATSYECQVNPYGMEVKSASDAFRFSIDFKIK